MDRGAQQAAAHGVTESDRTKQATFTFFGKIMTESIIRTYYLRIWPFGTVNILS